MRSFLIANSILTLAMGGAAAPQAKTNSSAKTDIAALQGSPGPVILTEQAMEDLNTKELEMDKLKAEIKKLDNELNELMENKAKWSILEKNMNEPAKDTKDRSLTPEEKLKKVDEAIEKLYANAEKHHEQRPAKRWKGLIPRTLNNKIAPAKLEANHDMLTPVEEMSEED